MAECHGSIIGRNDRTGREAAWTVGSFDKINRLRWRVTRRAILGMAHHAIHHVAVLKARSKAGPGHVA